MDNRKELKRQYKETKPQRGVFQIKNLKNGKIFVKSTSNLKTINGQKFQLENKSHRNKKLQVEWDEFGKDSFVFEILEILKEEEEESPFKVQEALKDLEEKWLENLRPFGERGYNTPAEK